MKKPKKQTFTTFLYKNKYTTGKNHQPYNQGVSLFGKECYKDLTPDNILNAFRFVVDFRRKAGMQDENTKQIDFILKYLKILQGTPEETKTPEECTNEK